MSGIESWSTTPANNNQSPPFGWPAGILPSQVEPIGRQMMTSIAAWYQAAEWINYNLTPTYVSATQFTLTGNDTAIYHVGRRVKATDGSTNVYGTITASAFTTLTTVTVAWDSGVLQTGVTIVYVGITSAVNTSAPAPTASALAGLAVTWSAAQQYTAAFSSGGSSGNAAIMLKSAAPALSWVDTAAGTDAKTWEAVTDTANWILRTSNDAGSAVKNALDVTRSGNAITQVTVGNATDLPPLTVNGPATVNAGNSSGPLIVNSSFSQGTIITLQNSGTPNGYVGGAQNLGAGNATDFGIRAQGNLYFFSNGGTARGSVSTIGAWAISAPTSSAPAVTITGTTNDTLVVNGSATTGSSFGVNIAAGTNSSDRGLLVQNRAGTVTQFQVRGDGLTQAVDQGGVLQDVGWRGTPLNTQSGNYSLVVSDRGKTVQTGVTCTYTVATGVFQAGDVVTLRAASGAVLTIAGSGVTLSWAGNGATTGNRTLTGEGLATLMFTGTSNATISGAGLT